MNIITIGTIRKLSDNETSIEIITPYKLGLYGIEQGESLDILYWMHRLNPEERQRMRVHPRGDKSRPIKGVFGLRSPMRPNPIGVSTTRVIRGEQGRLIVRPIDAIDNSPVIDIKSSSKGREVRSLVATWGRIHDTILHSLEESLSRERLKEILYDPMFQLGLKEAPGPKPDASAIGREIMRFEASWELEGWIVEDEPERFAREVTICPWSYMSPLGCLTFAWWMEGYCYGMNDEFEYRLEKLIPEGDSTCVWSVSKKKG